MHINEEKINEFMDEHGIEGFLRIYFAEFFYRNLMEAIKAGKNQGKMELDTGIQHHVSNELSGMRLKNRKKELRRECGVKAGELVSRLEEDDNFDELFEGDFEILESEEIQDKLNKHIVELAEEIGDEQ